jgi:hypothetical protein
MSCQVEQDLCPIHRGDSFNWTVAFKTDDGDAIDISGKKLFFTMKLTKNSVDGLAGDLQASVTFPADADSIAGLGTFSISKADTQDLTPGKSYYYDFQLTDPSDATYVKTLGFGKIKVLQDITLTDA